jgi:hypothetical protein
MDKERFDAVARSLSTSPSRRTVLGFALAGGLSALPNFFDAEARKKHKKKKKRKKKHCTPSCASKTCGDNGCGGSCGPCDGGECQNGACVCPFERECSPGLCCANEHICSFNECVACPVGATPCNFPQRCGKTSGGFPCVCVTSVDVETACVEDATRSIYCFACESDADCESELNPPGQTVCIANCGSTGEGTFCYETGGTGCAVKGCVDVETCDDPADCSAGTCIDHRCQ